MEAQDPLCVQCARWQDSCCQRTEVYCTPGDVQRIAAFTGLDDFYAHRRPLDPVYLEQDDDPLWAQYVIGSGQGRRILRQQPNGNCIFLGPQGCQLPTETRPLICRLYPFDYNADGLKDEMCRSCPVHLLPLGVGLLESLQMNRADAVRWHQQLYEEIQLEALADADRADLRPTC